MLKCVNERRDHRTGSGTAQLGLFRGSGVSIRRDRERQPAALRPRPCSAIGSRFFREPDLDRHRPPPRAEGELRLARLPQGARGQRAHHHAAARGRLRTDAQPCGRRSRDRQHLRLPRFRQAGIARRHRLRHERERQGDRHGLHGSGAGADRRAIPKRAGDHRSAGLRERAREGACGRPAQPRSVPRPRAAAGRQADAAPLRLSEDLGGLQQPLLLLHHSEAQGRPRIAAARRRHARGREAGERRRQGTARHLAGHQRLRPRHQVPGEPLARSRLAHPLLRPVRSAGRARRLGSDAFTSIPIRMSTR